MKFLKAVLEVHASRSINHSDPPVVAECESLWVEETCPRALSDWLPIQPKSKLVVGGHHG